MICKDFKFLLMKEFPPFCMMIALAVLSSALFQGCNENAGARENHSIAEISSKEQFPLSEDFKKYWYSGKAEISSYKLQQARYGEIHDGYAVAIFVTEDFSKSKQVKLDDSEAAGDDRLPVFKLNLLKKFNTGLYPYSMMLSVFSPVDINNYPTAVKTAASVQEWCGMTYTQLNSHQNEFNLRWNSYFEDEGDNHAQFSHCILEDELWSLIRMAPDRLPVGEQKLLPGSFYIRMTHLPFSVQSANLSLTEDGDTRIYTIDYLSEKHTLKITFEKNFPYTIRGWGETFPGFDGKLLTTTATLNKTIMSDYWVHHSNADRAMRQQLDIPENY
jgi:hypothetical protein